MTITRRTAALTLSYEDDGSMPEASELTDNPHQAVPRITGWMEAMNGGTKVGSLSMLVDDGDAVAATGSFTFDGVAPGEFASGYYTLSGVGGTAASGTITFSGSSGAWVATVNGVAFGGTSSGDDDAAGDDLASQIDGSEDPLVDGILSAANDNGVVTITATAKGVAGNAITLVVSGTGITRSGGLLTGGVDGAVTVEINGTTVGPVDTTDLSDADAATAVAAAIESDETLGGLLAAIGDGADVEIAWGTRGTVGNAVSLAEGVSATGTATRSGETLTGGTDTSVTATINGVGVIIDTTTATTDADAAVAAAAAIGASGNALVSGVVLAEANGDDVDLAAVEKGAAGNWITIAASGTGFSASGARLTGGADATNTATLER